jgi:hypothetical protein
MMAAYLLTHVAGTVPPWMLFGCNGDLFIVLSHSKLSSSAAKRNGGVILLFLVGPYSIFVKGNVS